MPKSFVRNNSDLSASLGRQTTRLPKAMLLTEPSNRLARNVVGKCKEQGRHDRF